MKKLINKIEKINILFLKTIILTGFIFFSILAFNSITALNQSVSLEETKFLSNKLETWEQQTDSKQWKYNCGIANVTTIYNYYNSDNKMTVDEMREYYGKDNIGTGSQDLFFLLKSFGLKAKLIITPINQNNIKTLVTNNDFVFLPVDMQELYNMETKEKGPNHSTLVRGYDEETNKIYLVDPNFDKTMSVDVEKVEKVSSFLDNVNFSIVIIVNN